MKRKEFEFTFFDEITFERLLEEHKKDNNLVFGSPNMYVAFNKTWFTVALKGQRFKRNNSQAFIHHVEKDNERKAIGTENRKFDWNGYTTEDNYALFEIMEKTK